jgi:hypothetical protein
MAGLKISELEEAVVANNGDFFPFVTGGVTKRITVKNLLSQGSDVYTTVNTNSANWSGGYTWVRNNSAAATFTTSVSAPALRGTHYGDGTNLTNIQSSNIVVPVVSTGDISSYVITSADHGKSIFLNNNTSPLTVNVNSNLFNGFTCEIIQNGTNSVTFVAGAGITLNSFGNATKLGGQWSAARLIQVSNSTFHLAGNLQY